MLPSLLSVKEFIDNSPKSTAYRPTLVRLSNQINEMKQRDAEFLRQEKNKLQKCLTDVREREEKQASDWIDRMMTGAVPSRLYFTLFKLFERINSSSRKPQSSSFQSCKEFE